MIDRLRPVQARIIKEMIEAVKKKKRYICLHAPTGIGKTLTAITFALYCQSFMSAVSAIFVRTRSQLSCYVRDCARFLNALPSIRLAKAEACPLYRAKSGLVYPCSRCNLRRSVTDEPIVAQSVYETLLDKVKRTDVHDPYNYIPYISNFFCPYYFFKSLHKLTGLNMHVCTYPYLTKLADVLLSELEEEYPNNPRVAIIDEAHNLEDTTLLTLSTIDIKTVQKAMREVEKHVTPLSEELANLVLNILETVHEFIMYYRAAKVPDEYVISPDRLAKALLSIADLEKCLDAVEEAANIVVEKYRRIVAASGGSEKISPAIVDVLDFLTVTLCGEDIVLVYVADSLEARLMTVKVRELTEDYDIVVLMSGTLPPKDYVIRAWKIPKQSLAYLDYSKHQIGHVEKYVDPSVTTKYVERSLEMFSRYADKLLKIANRAPMHTLVIVPSYDIADLVSELMRQKYPKIEDRLVIEREGMTFGAVQKKVLEEKRLVIVAVAGGKLTEGVEFTKNGRSLISDVAVVGIPYSPPTMYMQLLEKSLAERGGLGIDYVKNVHAWILIRQALGRSVRHPEDRCRWWLLDYRYLEPFWKEKLLGEDFKIVHL